ncbi:MAG: pirin family protein [Deltaproteobacteria bacterium]|nr:pirin family protein [Deltaproteobacteria bacterium]
METLFRADQRGRSRMSWLDSAHTFSFADFYDPGRMGFRSLRVINDDVVAPAAGFGTHPHRDMEIVTYVISGALRHRDSMGNGSAIVAGEVQRMSAGTGVAHSEMNDSPSEPVHLLQIWLRPERAGLTPGYAQKHFPREDKLGRLRTVVAPDGADGAVSIHQDARILATILRDGESVTHPLAPGRHAFVQVARGEVRLGDRPLSQGDGVALSEVDSLTLTGAGAEAEVLVFDLA